MAICSYLVRFIYTTSDDIAEKAMSELEIYFSRIKDELYGAKSTRRSKYGRCLVSVWLYRNSTTFTSYAYTYTAIFAWIAGQLVYPSTMKESKVKSSMV